jgi:hypothetical protein
MRMYAHGGFSMIRASLGPKVHSHIPPPAQHRSLSFCAAHQSAPSVAQETMHIFPRVHVPSRERNGR